MLINSAKLTKFSSIWRIFGADDGYVVGPKRLWFWGNYSHICAINKHFGTKI